MHLTLETDNNLIVDEYQKDEYVDFLSQKSLSEHGYPMPKLKIKNQELLPPPNSKDVHVSLFTSPLMSPNYQGTSTNEQLILKTPKSVKNQLVEKQTQQYRNSQSTIGEGMMKYLLIKRFFNRFMRSMYLFSRLQKHHLDILNDNAANYNLTIFGRRQFNFRPMMKNLNLPQIPSFKQKLEKQLKHSLKRIETKIEQWNQQIPIFQPEERKKIYWDSCLLITRLYFIILIPMEIVFEEDFLYSSQLYVVTVIMTILMVCDLLLNFNTSYYQFGMIVNERSKIFKHVIIKSYGCDVISVIYLFVLMFIDWETQQDNKQYIMIGLLTFFGQFQNITKLIRLSEEVLNLSKIVASLLELLKLIVFLIFILHVSTCIWYGVGNYGYHSLSNSWLTKYQLGDNIWAEKYLRSFYFCTVTMFTVGYGDVTPQTNFEYVICIIFIMIFSIQLPYSVTTVGAIIDEISKYSEQKLQKLRIINTYMNKKKISFQLQFQIREYLNYYWEMENTLQSNEEQIIIEQLSGQLRESLMIEANSVILNNTDIFKYQFSSAFKRELVKNIRPIFIQPESIIEYSNESDYYQNKYLTFIESGEVEVQLSDQVFTQKTTLYKLQANQCFGLYEFITGQEQKEVYKSVGFTKLLILPKSIFMKILKDFQEDKEKFCQIRDNLIYNFSTQSLKLLSQPCYVCQSKEHRFGDCPLLHFCPDKERIIKSHQFHQQQQRDKKYRKKTNKNDNRYYNFNALLDQKIIVESAEYIQDDYWKETQIYDLDIDALQNQSPNSPQQSQSSEEQEDEINHELSRRPSFNSSQKFARQTRTTRLLEANQMKKLARKSSISPMIPRTSSQVIEIAKPSLFSPSRQQTQLQDGNQQVQTPETSIQIQKTPTNCLIPLKQNFMKSALKKLETNTQIENGDQNQIEERAKRVKVKFQQAFSFIKKLKHLKSNKEIEKNQRIQQKQQTLMLQKQNLHLIQQRVMRKSQSLSQQDTRKLNLLIIEINNQLNNKFQDLQNFENKKDFKYYLPHNNLANLQISTKFHPKFLSNMTQYIKYFFYPYEFIRKFKKTDPTILEIKPISFATQINAYRDVLKFRKQARKIINKKQIAPE